MEEGGLGGEFFKDILKSRKRPGDIFHSNRYWERKYAVYVPTEDWLDSIYGVHAIGSDYYQAKREAPLLRKRIIDEDQPLKMRMPFKAFSGIFTSEGGRISDAMLLGMIKYSEACPELLESATHDLEYEMRAVSVESLGEMERKAFGFAGGISKIMLNDENLFVRGYAARALGKIGNPASLSHLRHAFEEAKSMVRVYHREYWIEGKKECFTDLLDAASILENTMLSIFKLDPKQGREVLAEGLSDENPSVYHFSKNAAFFAKYS